MDNAVYNKGKSPIEIYQQHLQMVYRIAYTYLCNRAEAENAAQEVFARLVRANINLNDDLGVKAWIITTVTNVCLKKINNPGYELVPDPNPHEIDRTMAALMELPGKYKTVAYLFYFEGLTAREIAELMGDEMQIISTIVSKTRCTLTMKLGGDFDD